MRSEKIVLILQLVCFVLMLISLYFKSTLSLVTAAIVMAVCVAVSFYCGAREK